VRRTTAVLIALVVTVVLATGVARAITYGDLDGTAHPYVGLVALYDDNVYKGRCSGALITSTVVLTAAHCILDTNADRARVYLEPTVTDDLAAPSAGLTGTPHAHPSFTDLGALPNTSDVAVIVLDKPAFPARFASLAPVGSLDGGKGSHLVVVGYGLQGVKPRILDEKSRFAAAPKVKALENKITDGWNVKTSNNKQDGGTCFGDSGAPLLLEGTDSIVAVNSFGKDDSCTKADFSYRVDTAYAQTWLAGYLR
jgi:secreted trypsin-like serine protease